MTGSIRNFEKLNFTPKSSVFCFSQGQTSKYDRLAHKLLKNLSGVGMLPPEITYMSVKASNDQGKANLFNTFLSSVFKLPFCQTSRK